MEVLNFILSILIVFIASLLFTNGIEYISNKLKFTKSFTGTIITPLFSSFPELIVFIIALIFVGGIDGEGVAIGTVLGEPFIVSTISLSIIFITIIIKMYSDKKFEYFINVEKVLYIPYLFITIFFSSLLIPAYINLFHFEIGLILIISYAIYFYIIGKKEGEKFEEVEGIPYFSRFTNVKVGTVLQLLISFILLYFGSKTLVSSIIEYSHLIGISSMTLSIVIVPIATAMPETMISMIWALKRKYTLAIYSIIGEIILCSSIYPGLAMLIVPWALNKDAIISIIFTSIISFIYLIFSIRGKIPIFIFILGLIMFFIFLIIL
ncbi:MAG: hypothetical protein QXG55_03275 [Thermoplasmata archaeon]